ncbi:hypothetical protein Psch_00247 [Pelotomaculum schinkii]|uniref:DUF2953 domain-containing protein n=1 Tax=Pelotomaculum schinkii TaxID=78350 RepID=A0A4Y7RCH2_9FIRM|nr:DUF2953 domain-containing protein [Pelotomaculum schinkii]TEB06715.1 hypothetical protein Psch_00247 [Pelotomaculum schinkii]
MGRTQLVMILVGTFALILSLTSLKMRLHYRRQGRDDHFALKLSLWRGLISYKMEIPVVKTELKPGFRPWRRPLWPRTLRPAFKIEAKVTGKNDPDPVGKIEAEEVLGLKRILFMMQKSKIFFENYMPAIRYLLGKVYLRRFQWSTEFGMEEPHVTGFLAGLAGGVKGLLLAKLYRVIHSGAARPAVVITPRFEKPCFTTRIDCELDIKVGHIFLTGLKFVFMKLKG